MLCLLFLFPLFMLTALSVVCTDYQPRPVYYYQVHRCQAPGCAQAPAAPPAAKEAKN